MSEIIRMSIMPEDDLTPLGLSTPVIELGGASKSYVDARDEATLAEAKKYTDANVGTIEILLRTI